MDIRRVIKHINNRPNYKEFQKSFKPILYLTKIFGHFIYEICEVSSTFKIKRNTYGIITVIIIFIIYSMITCYMRIYNISIWKLEGIAMLRESIQIFSCELYFYVTILTTIMRQKKFLKVIENIFKLDTLLFELDEEISYAKEFKRHMLLLLFFLTSIVCSLSLNCAKQGQSNLTFVFHLVRWALPFYYIFAVMLQFSLMVHCLKIRCFKLNVAISKVIMLKNKEKPNVVPNIESEYENRKFNYRNCNTEIVISNVSIIYDMIYQIGIATNKVFSFQITIGLLCNNIFLTFTTYTLIKYIIRLPESINWEYIVLASFTLVYGTLTLYGMIYCCNGTKTEANNVAILMHKVNANKTEHREMINRFSLQSLHQKVQFTACGLFELDYTFIYLAFSTLVTYMVILVQSDT